MALVLECLLNMRFSNIVGWFNNNKKRQQGLSWYPWWISGLVVLTVSTVICWLMGSALRATLLSVPSKHDDDDDVWSILDKMGGASTPLGTHKCMRMREVQTSMHVEKRHLSKEKKNPFVCCSAFASSEMILRSCFSIQGHLGVPIFMPHLLLGAQSLQSLL